MPRRTILTERQRQALFGLPTDKTILFRHYVLSDQDIEFINRRRRPENKLGFALQLCVLRYPGRLLQPGEEIPTELIEFVGSQIGLSTDELLTYGQRKQTRYQHSTSLQRLYGYTKFDLKNDSRFRAWLKNAAEQASSNEGFAKTVTEELRKHKIIVPAPSTLERLCADSLVAAENRITKRIASKLDNAMKERLLSLLEETLPQKITRFVWLRQFEAGNNSRAINLLMDRLDCLNEIALPPKVLVNVPHHRISRLRRQGERYYADGMRDLPDHRRLAILAVCVIEWKSQLSDSIIESHDRIVGKLYRASERARDTQISEQRNLIHQTLKSFADVGKKLVAAQENGESLERVIETKCGWEKFSGMVDNAVDLNRTVAADPLDFVSSGYLRFRRYIPRLLKNLDIKADRAGKPLLLAVDKLRHLNETGNTKPLVDPPIEFARPKWRARLRRRKSTDRKFWEIAVLFSLRDGFRSGDIWLEDGREFARLPAQLIPIEAVMKSNSLAVPYDVNDWLNQRKIMLEQAFSAGGEAVRCNRLPNSTMVY